MNKTRKVEDTKRERQSVSRRKKVSERKIRDARREKRDWKWERGELWLVPRDRGGYGSSRFPRETRQSEELYVATLKSGAITCHASVGKAS